MNRKQYAEPILHGEPDFPIAIYRITLPSEAQTLTYLHYHPELELLTATQNTLLVRIEEQNICLRPGEGLFIRASLLHSIHAADPGEHGFLAAVFSPELLCTREDRIYQTYLRPLINGSLEVPLLLNSDQIAALHTIAELFHQKPYGYELKVKQLLLQILHEQISHASLIQSPRIRPRLESLKTALTYMEQHYSEDIALQDLAKAAGLSREYFCRIFSEVSGTSPIDYLNQYRVKQSTLLLRDSSLTVSEISALCGFHSCSYFNKMFRRFVGKSPLEYRNQTSADLLT